MKSCSSILLIFIAAIFSNCAGPTVQTHKKTGVNMSNYQTYAWLPMRDSISDERYKNLGLEETIIDEVNEKMIGLGYTLDRDNPDLLVLIHTMLQKETSTVTEPIHTTYNYYTPNLYIGNQFHSYYYNNYSTITRVTGYNINEIQYTEGTIIVDLIERETNRVIWRGIAEDYIEPVDVQQEVRTYVSAIFEEFPTEDF